MLPRWIPHREAMQQSEVIPHIILTAELEGDKFLASRSGRFNAAEKALYTHICRYNGGQSSRGSYSGKGKVIFLSGSYPASSNPTVSPRGKAAEATSWPLTSIYYRGKKWRSHTSTPPCIFMVSFLITFLRTRITLCYPLYKEDAWAQKRLDYCGI
jgi:hypothetical protein